MAIDDFKTVPDELLHVAAEAEEHYAQEGYDVSIEARDIGFPVTPTLVCRAGHETVIVEVSSSLDTRRCDRWIRFCRSMTTDTRFCLVIRTREAVDHLTMQYAIDNRVGLCVHNDERLMEVRPALDLALHIALPDLQDLKPAVRKLLAPTFRKINAGDWRDGLSDAYLEVEELAREYLKTHITSGRVVINVTIKKVTRQLTPDDIEAMTLGQLKDAFAKIQNQTAKDARIASTLALINKTRVGLAHRRRRNAVEAELRLQVGQHMYAVINCLDDLTN